MSTDPKPEIRLDVNRKIEDNWDLIYKNEKIEKVMENLREHDWLTINNFKCNQPEYKRGSRSCEECRPRFGNISAGRDEDKVQVPRGWIGSYPFTIRCGRKKRNLDWGENWNLFFRPSNISVEAAKKMIEDVETFLKGLARDLWSPTYVYSYLDPKKYQSTLYNRLQLMLKVAEELIPEIYRLSPSAYSRIKRIEKLQRVKSIRRFDYGIVKRLMQQPLIATALSSQTIQPRRAYLRLPVSEPSPDIYEHRFVRWFIDRICNELQDRIRDVQISLDDVDKQITYAQNRNWENDVEDYGKRRDKHLDLRNKTETVICRLRNVVKTTFLDEIPPLKPPLQMTHLLRRNPVYRTIYELYLWLFRDLKVELDPSFEEELFRQSLERTSQIYEYWGLVSTIGELQKLGFEPRHDDSLLKKMGNRLYVRIDEGTKFRFTRKNLHVLLYFDYDHRNHKKPYFKFQWLPEPSRYSEKHHSTPDLHLCFLRSGREYLGSLILDTKYKSLDDCGRGTKSYGQIKYYQEAISAIDSIRPIWSYILFVKTDDEPGIDFLGQKTGYRLLSPDTREESLELLSDLIQEFIDEIDFR